MGRKITRKANKTGREGNEQRDTKTEDIKREKTKDRRERKESLFSSNSWKRAVHCPADDPVSSWPAWYHGWCRKAEVEQKLKEGPEGFFLVKNSTEFPGDLTLCLVCGGRCSTTELRERGLGIPVIIKNYSKM